MPELDPRTGTDARSALVERLTNLRDRQALQQDVDDLDAVLAALAAVPAPTDEGRAETVDRCLTAVNAVPVGWHLDSGQCGRGTCPVCRRNNVAIIEAVLSAAAAVPASAPTGETREGR